MPATHWVHDLSPFLIRFPDSSFGIRYYGLAYVLGLLAGVWLLRLYHRRGVSPLPAGKAADLVLYLAAGVFIGGRLGYFLLYDPSSLIHSPLQIFKVWSGGMASHGGFIGVVIAMAWFCRRHGLPLLAVADRVVTAVPPGLFLGRVANFINGELWGRVSDVPWAVIFPGSAPEGTPAALIEPRHPSQLYEAALEGLVLGAWMQWRLWRRPDLRDAPGRLSGEFLAAYALLRIAGECFREPDAALIMGLSRGTFYSIFILTCGIGLIAWSLRKKAVGGGQVL